MCGIAGIIERSPRPEVLESMLLLMSSRGPDGSGQWRSEKDGWHVSLGHRRLSIIDLEGGHQPLGVADGAVQIIFNGEIYNFPELKESLEREGSRFNTKSDTETIAHLYVRKGRSHVEHLNGMFAYAIWDQREKELFLARDHAGIKPLFYASLPDGGLIFGSELRGIIQHPAVARRWDSTSVAAYFFHDYCPGDRTVIKGVRKLEAGHFITWKDGKLSDPRPFFTLPKTDQVQAERPEMSLVKDLRTELDAAVKRSMISDVPVGVFLSGGIDSSLVAALAQRHASEPLMTFSIAFDDARFDESSYARLVATQLKTRHFEQRLTESNLIEAVDGALSSLHEPMADHSLIPCFLLSKLAVQHVKVALGGDGGDELFAGYLSYKAHRYADSYGALPSWVRKKMLPTLLDLIPVGSGYQPWDWKLKRFVLRYEDDLLRRHLRWVAATDGKDISRALNISQEEGLPPYPVVAHGEDRINNLLSLDYSTYLSGSVLSKVDQASMANSLEVRPPLLDKQIVNWAFRVPGHFKLRRGRLKSLLKEAASGLLPDAIINRPKHGFSVPLSHWLKTSLSPQLNAILKQSPLWENQLFCRSTFLEWSEQHREGRKDWSKSLWSLIVLDHWARKSGVGT